MLQKIGKWRHGLLALELLLLALILFDFVRIVVRLLGVDASLSWDEAVYADRARAWVAPDIPLSGWSYIRPPLVPLLASVAVAAGGDEWQLRLIGLVAGLGLILAAWWLARSMGGRLAGLTAAAILLVSPTLQLESAALLTDVPAAALTLLVVALLWTQLELRDRPGAGLLVATVMACLAFLARYGSLLALLPLVAIAAALWWRRLIGSPRQLVATLAIALAFAVAHITWSITQTGSPLGILLAAQRVVPPDRAGASTFGEFLGYLPFLMAGSPGYPLMIGGVVGAALAAVAAVRSPTWRPALRALLLLTVPAVAYVILVSAGIGHAEARYFVIPAALLVIAGSVTLGLVARQLPSPLGAGLAVAVGAAVLLSHGSTARYSLDRTSVRAAVHGPIRAAATQLAALADEDCGVVGGADPIVAWYSECETNRLRLQADGGSPARNLHARQRWALILAPRDQIDLSAPVMSQVVENALSGPIDIIDPQTGRAIAAAWRLP